MVLLAHRECNASTSWDETWIATTYAVAQTPALRRQEIYDRSIRRLTREGEGKGFAKAFLESIIVHPSGDGAIKIDNMKLGYFLAKIAKGMAYYEHRLVLGDAYRWMWTQLTPDEFVKTPYLASRNVHDLVFAKWHLTNDGGTFMCWIALREANCHFIAARWAQEWGDGLANTTALPWPRLSPRHEPVGGVP